LGHLSSTEVDDILGAEYPYYYAGLRQRRAEYATANSLDMTILVLDGHQKLTRRVCAADRVTPAIKSSQSTDWPQNRILSLHIAYLSADYDTH
jgi:hypothetical protein